MKLLKMMKDGGNESTVTGYWLIEAKSLFSICLLRFEGASREAYHSHAFNCLSWVVRGKLSEQFLSGTRREHCASLKPFVTTRQDFHKVSSDGDSWVLTFRGPWARSWKEYIPASNEVVTLTEGRRRVMESSAGPAT